MLRDRERSRDSSIVNLSSSSAAARPRWTVPCHDHEHSFRSRCNGVVRTPPGCKSQVANAAQHRAAAQVGERLRKGAGAVVTGAASRLRVQLAQPPRKVVSDAPPTHVLLALCLCSPLSPALPPPVSIPLPPPSPAASLSISLLPPYLARLCYALSLPCLCPSTLPCCPLPSACLATCACACCRSHGP